MKKIVVLIPLLLFTNFYAFAENKKTQYSIQVKNVTISYISDINGTSVSVVVTTDIFNPAVPTTVEVTTTDTVLTLNELNVKEVDWRLAPETPRRQFKTYIL